MIFLREIWWCLVGEEHGDEVMGVCERICWTGLKPAFEFVGGFVFGSFLSFCFFGRIGMNGWIRAMDGWSQPAR